MTNNIFFDDKEKRSRDKREQDLFDNFEKTFSLVKNNSEFYTRTLSNFAKAPKSRDELAMLPILRKSDLTEIQKKHFHLEVFLQVIQKFNVFFLHLDLSMILKEWMMIIGG